MNPDMTISDREAQDQELYELGKENFEFRERIRTLEAKLDAVRGLPKMLKLCAEALEIASDWYVEDVQIFPPKTWGLPAHNEDAAKGWCSTFALADRARKVAEELEAALQSAEGPGSNQPELDNTKSEG